MERMAIGARTLTMRRKGISAVVRGGNNHQCEDVNYEDQSGSGWALAAENGEAGSEGGEEGCWFEEGISVVAWGGDSHRCEDIEDEDESGAGGHSSLSMVRRESGGQW